MTEPWMLDELAHAGPEHLDPAFVTADFDRRLYGAYTCLKAAG